MKRIGSRRRSSRYRVSGASPGSWFLPSYFHVIAQSVGPQYVHLFLLLNADWLELANSLVSCDLKEV